MSMPAHRIATLVLILLLSACKKEESTIGQPSATRPRAAMRVEDSSHLGRTTDSVPAPPPPRRAARSDSGPPFERMAGYVVRGTDESSFRRCGSSRTHYIRATGESAINLTQRYRFRARTPLSPVYFLFNARVREDTMRVGDHTYTSVLEVRRVLAEQPGATPECPAPMPGSMIEGR